MLNRGKIILEKAEKIFPSFKMEFDNCYNKSEQVIIFGSFASECENERSDIDILFIGGQKRRLSRWLDFIWLRPEKLYSWSWLGSELASHISKYGVWVKGDDSWKERVFFSKAAITRKKEKILFRLVHILVKKESLSLESKKDLFIKVIMNCHRLKLLNNHIAIPPTAISARAIVQEPLNLLSEMLEDKMLGPTFGTILKDIFPQMSIDELYSELKRELFLRYELGKRIIPSMQLDIDLAASN